MDDEQYTARLKLMLEAASEKALLLNATEVNGDHMLLALLEDEMNDACFIIERRLGIDVESLYDELTQYVNIKNTSSNNVFFNSLMSGEDVEMSMNNDLVDVYNRMRIINKKELGYPYISTLHLLISLLDHYEHEGDEGIRNILKSYGIDRNNIVETSKQIEMEQNQKLRNQIEDPSGESSKGGSGKGQQKKTEQTKTPVLMNFCRDISKEADQYKLDPVVGREGEIKRVSQILSRRKKNNPVLIGEAGVGKTAIVEGLAQIIRDGEAPIMLMNKKIYSLDMASLVAGTKYRGQFEERLKALIEEIKQNPEIVLFIDEIHTIVGAGSANDSLDASNIFKPALAKGEIQCIGATTLDEHRENIEGDGALNRRFQEVMVKEPNLEETRTILKNIQERYENHHMVNYTEEALDECIRLSDRYMTEKAMPDKAIDVLDEAGAITNADLELPEHIKEMQKEKEDIQKEKQEVVKNQEYEKAAELRDREVNLDEEIESEKKKYFDKINSERKEVDGELVRDVVSMMTGIPTSKLDSKETKELQKLDDHIKERVIGQQEACEKAAQAIKRNKTGLKNPNKPISSFMFLGPTGVGKTHLAQTIAELVMGHPDNIIRVDMGEYGEKFSSSRLIGSPPGYVGYEKGGELTEKVRRNPYSVVLFDEIEKAHPEVFDVLLQVLDEGYLNDNHGRKINFKNTVIILTSNVGAREVNDFGEGVGFNTTAKVANKEDRKRSFIKKALNNNFKPEFLNRIDETIIFNNLSKDDIHQIVYTELEDLKERLREQGDYKLNITKQAIGFIAEQGYDDKFGARELKRAIETYIEDGITDKLLNNEIDEGDTIKISYSKKEDNLSIKVNKKAEE